MLTPMSIERMMLAVVFGVLVAGAVTACQPHAMVSNPEAEMHAGPLTTSRPDAPSLAGESSGPIAGLSATRAGILDYGPSMTCPPTSV